MTFHIVHVLLPSARFGLAQWRDACAPQPLFGHAHRQNGPTLS